MPDGKKLYFDFEFTASNRSRYFPCTWYEPSPFAPPASVKNIVVNERHGQIMDALPALTGGAPSDTKLRRDVGVWFHLIDVFTQPVAGPWYTDVFGLNFVGRDLNTETPYLLPGGAQDAAKVGHTPIFTQHFAVRLDFASSTNRVLSAHGVCYVQRQHSVEV